MDNTTIRGLYFINKDRQYTGKESNKEDSILRDPG